MIGCVQLKMYRTSAIFQVICHYLLAVSWHSLMTLFTFNFGYGIDSTFRNITSRIHLYMHVELSSSDVEACIINTLYATYDDAMVNHCIFSRRYFLVKLIIYCS